MFCYSLKRGSTVKLGSNGVRCPMLAWIVYFVFGIILSGDFDPLLICKGGYTSSMFLLILFPTTKSLLMPWFYEWAFWAILPDEVLVFCTAASLYLWPSYLPDIFFEAACCCLLFSKIFSFFVELVPTLILLWGESDLWSITPLFDGSFFLSL